MHPYGFPQAHKERLSRRWDQDEQETATGFLPAAVHAGGRVEEGRSWRLDVQLGRLEFGVHPRMALEHQLVRRAHVCIRGPMSSA